MLDMSSIYHAVLRSMNSIKIPCRNASIFHRHTDKKENKIFLIYKEIQSGAVAKSYMTDGLLIYGEIFANFLIY